MLNGNHGYTIVEEENEEEGTTMYDGSKMSKRDCGKNSTMNSNLKTKSNMDDAEINKLIMA
jgi:hypothetical protein